MSTRGVSTRPVTDNTVEIAGQILETLKVNGPANTWRLSRSLKISMSKTNQALIYITAHFPNIAETDDGKIFDVNLGIF